MTCTDVIIGTRRVHGITEGKKKDIGMTGIQRDDGQLVRQVIQECSRRYGG